MPERPDPAAQLRRARPVFTGRALVLATLAVLLVIVLASPVSRYLGSRSDVSHAAQQLRTDQQQYDQLSKELALWSDPGFVQQQARTRLQYAMPGDTVYVVVKPGQQSEIAKTSGDADAASKNGPTWNQRLWQSVTATNALP